MMTDDYTKKEVVVEYKFKKKVTGEALLSHLSSVPKVVNDESSCEGYFNQKGTDCERRALDIYVSRFGMFDEPKLPNFIAVARNHGWIDWLINRGLIEVVEQEETYHLGQQFDVSYDYPFIFGKEGDVRTLMLVATPGSYAMLVCVKGKHKGTYWKHQVRVKNLYKITREEMLRISGGEKNLSRFKLQ